MFHSFRTRAGARTGSDKPDGLPASWNSMLRRDRFNPLTERLFEADSRRTHASRRPITSCEVVDFSDGPVIAHHAKLLNFCDSVVISATPPVPDWGRGLAGAGHHLLCVNVDIFEDVDCAVSYLQEFREIAPLASVIIASSGFARDEFDSSRAVITDISLRLPLSCRSLETALLQVSRETGTQTQRRAAAPICTRL